MKFALLQYKFSVRIFISFLLIILIPFAITLAVSYHVIRQVLEIELRENLQKNVTGYAEQIRFLEESSLRIARELAADTALCEDLARNRITSVRIRLANYHRLGIADLLEIENPEGEVIARGHNPLLAGDVKNQQAIIRAGLAGQSVASYEKGRSGLAVRAVAPLRKDGVILGVLMVGTSFSDQLVAHMKLLTGLENGIYMGREKIAATYENYEELSPAILASLMEGKIASDHDALINGLAYEATFHPLFLHDGTYWGALAMASNRAQIDLFSRYSRNLLFLLVGVGLLIAFVVYFQLARHIHAALTSIIRGIENVRVGDFDTTIDWKKDDEFGRIAESFNRMIRKINLYHRRIAELQEGMIRAAKAATAGQIAAGMAHEIRNPLTSIRLMVQVLNRRFPPKECPEVDVLLEEIDRIDLLMKQLLEFGRPTPMHFARHDLNAIVESVLKLFRHQIEHQKIEVAASFQSGLPPLQVDAEKMRIVLVNLVLNAIQALPDGGRLAIETSLSAEERDVMIRVEDTGAGIAPEDRRKIFEPFYTSKAGGTGLGLALTEAIVSRHQGRIEVESAPGGTVFSVFLPISPGTVEEGSAMERGRGD